MSYPDIPVDQPDPFFENPELIFAPYTKVQHFPSSNAFGLTGPMTLSAGQTVTGLVVVSNSSSGNTVTLPSAQSLLDSYGSANQVQVGDYLVLPVYNLSGTAVPFAAGAGGSGSGSAANNKNSALAISFTNTTYGSVAYTFSVQ